MEPGRTTASLRVVVSNTGPMISALQGDCMHILRQLYDLVHIPASELAEFEEHDAGMEIRMLIETGFIAAHNLTDSERVTARAIAEEIARLPVSRDKDPAHHYPEAEAIALMEREDLEAVELLVDELAARGAAQRRGIASSDFQAS
jgi:predicted nucleic acid-binding protein